MAEPGDYVDIVIVNYNTRKYLEGCLNSIQRYTDYPHKLIIIDNNSTDESRQYLRKIQCSPGVIVIYNSENVGTAKAWNQGIRAGRGKYILFLNPDTHVLPNWLGGMVDCAKSDSKIAVVGNKQIDGHGVINYAGVILEAGQPVFRGAGEKDSPDKFTEVTDCVDVCGACYLIKRELIPVIGYFDERFFLYAEESDYSQRALQVGYRVVYAPTTIIHYKNGAPMTSEARQKMRARSAGLFSEKWRGKH